MSVQRNPAPAGQERAATAAGRQHAWSRRAFVASVGVAGLAGGVAPEAAAFSPASAAGLDEAASLEDGLIRRTLDVRVSTARANAARPRPASPANGDEERYPNRIGSDTRGLPHDERGEVDPSAWRTFIAALRSGDPAEFEKLPLGGARKHLNPTGSLAASLSGLAPPQFSIPPAHALASSALAAEAVEIYWTSLLRDVPLSEFRDDTSNPDIRAAVDDLNALADFTGLKAGGRVTPGTLFRANALYVDPADPSGRTRRYASIPGVADGPVVSQFLFRDIPWANQFISAKIRTYTPASTFHTAYDEWLAIQNGAAPRRAAAIDPVARYIATGRDLAAYAHFQPVSYQAAALLLSTGASAAHPAYGGIFPGAQTPWASSNPYTRSRTQTGGTSTFGGAYVQGLIAQAASLAIRTAYFQKFWVHRSLRPEAYAGLIHHRLAKTGPDYPVHDTVLGSKGLELARSRFGTHLITQVYPEGSPIHAAYPGGATIIGAVQATILKAFFDESREFPNPVEVDPSDPTKLVPYRGPALTIGGELNKLAINYGTGRIWAGIHWRSDLAASVALGEEVAIAVLRDERAGFRENFDGFSFTRFDGSRVTV